MKTTYHTHLRGSNGCLGFYYGLEALQSDFPEGGLPGEFFINGETQSLWIWDATKRAWVDTCHVSLAPFLGVIASPETFSPSLDKNTKGCFIYSAGHKGTYEFPLLSGSDKVEVEANSAGIITLEWDGHVWSSTFTPLSLENITIPTMLFQGEYNSGTVYSGIEGVTDVVYYCGNYYRVKPGVEEAGHDLCPDESEEWEMLSRYTAKANEVELIEGGCIDLLNGQSINSYWEDDYGYSFGNGSLTHEMTGTTLDKDGNIRIPFAGGIGELILFPDDPYCCGGISLLGINEDGELEEKLRLVIDEGGECRITASQSYWGDDYVYDLMIEPVEYKITKHLKGNPYGRVVNVASLSRTGLNLPSMKSYDDELKDGDLYYDEDYIVHIYKE